MSIEKERAERRFLRPVAVSDTAAAAYEAFVRDVAARLDDGDRNEAVAQILRSLYGLKPGDERDPLRAALWAACDPRNATLEPEYYRDIDTARYAPLKPLHWLWIMFDRSPVGRDLHLGVLFRRMLAERLFKRCGKNVKIFHDVEFTYGYNLEVGDNVVIHRSVLLDDRGGLVIGNNVSIADFANIYTHDHDILDIGHVTMRPVRIGDGARITYHATVLCADVGEDAIVASHGLLRKPVGPHQIAGGVPAKVFAEKPKPGQSV